MNNIILKVVCPQCNETVKIMKPEKAGRHVFKCNHCGQKFAVNIKDDTEVVEDVKPGPETTPVGPQPAKTRVVSYDSGKLLHLFRKKRFRSDEEYKLKIGENIIGRKSDKSPSDIMIDDDNISRRSASIKVDRIEQGLFNYLFTLLKTTNPVSLNGKQIIEGTSVYLKSGDEIKMGNTCLYIK